MKKLMFAVAAVTAGVAFADVTSANIVGYSNYGLRNGGKMVTAQFLGLNNPSNDIQQLLPQGDDTIDNVQVQLLDEYGRMTVQYNWKDGGDLDEPVSGYCWANEDNEYKVEDVMFGPGQGLWVFGSATEQALQSSGEVNKKDVSVKLRNGGSGFGNPFPVKVDIQDILPTGPDTIDNVQIQILDEYGRMTVQYNWKDGGDLDEPVAGYCWANEDNEYKVSGVDIDPGQGLWVFGSSTDQFLTFPAPEL